MAQKGRPLASVEEIMTMRAGRGEIRMAMAVAAALAVLSCGLPRDSDGTLDRVQNGVIRLGVADDSPWVVVAGQSVSGYEPAIVGQLAREMRARVETTHGPEARLFEK